VLKEVLFSVCKQEHGVMKQHDVEAPNDGWLRLRCSTALVHEVEKHARAKRTTLSAFTRAAVIAALEADGARKRSPRQSEVVTP
jgi:hypothetical protein